MNNNKISNEHKPKKRSTEWIFGTVLCLALLMAYLTVPAFAADKITESITAATSNGMSILKAIVIPIAGIYIAIQGIKLFLGDRNGIENAKRNMLIAIGAIALVLGAEPIAEAIAGWFA